jgi:phage gpG-like protein
MAKNFKYLQRDFNKFQRKLALFEANDFPYIVATEAENHYRASFQNQGFTDRSLKPWKARKNNKDSGRAILLKTGELRDSIKAIPSPKLVRVVSDKAYAKVHNQGGRAGKGLSAKIPQRQFMGDSEVLSAKILHKANISIHKIFKTTIG